MTSHPPPSSPVTLPSEAAMDAQQIMLLLQQHCQQHGLRLTASRSRVLRVMAEAGSPLKAYAILERVRSAHPSTAPVAIYRALEFLRKQSFVVKLNAINGFLLRLPGPAWQSAYLVCEQCGSVNVVEGPAVHKELIANAHISGFTPATRSLEIAGICHACRRTA